MVKNCLDFLAARNNIQQAKSVKLKAKNTLNHEHNPSHFSFFIIRYSLTLAACIIGILFLFVLPHTATAQTQAKQGIEVQPAYIDVDLTPKDASEEIVLTYTNHSKSPVTLELYPIDFRPTDQNGGIGFTQSNSEYLYSLSSYLSFESNRLDLDRGETKQFTLIARNRQDLTPGGHYAAVVARVVQSASDETLVAPAVSSLIFLRKTGGESYNLSLQELSWPSTISFSYPSTITGLFQNDGNTHLIPTGRMEVKDVFGRVLYEGALNEAFVRVLPSSKRYIPVYLRQLQASLPLSVNTMTISGTDSLKKVTYSRTDVFIYVHPLFFVFILITALASIVWLRRRKRNMKREERSQPQVIVEKPVKTIKKRRAKSVKRSK